MTVVWVALYDLSPFTHRADNDKSPLVNPFPNHRHVLPHVARCGTSAQRFGQFGRPITH